MKTKTTTVLIFVALLLTISLSVLNNIFVTQPRVQAAIKEVNIGTIKNVYAQCISNGEDNYSRMWDNSCLSLGKGKDCMLPDDTANTYTAILKESRNTCLELYKLDMISVK